jgi:hypothetical protein
MCEKLHVSREGYKRHAFTAQLCFHPEQVSCTCIPFFSGNIKVPLWWKRVPSIPCAPSLEPELPTSDFYSRWG